MKIVALLYSLVFLAFAAFGQKNNYRKNLLQKIEIPMGINIPFGNSYVLETFPQNILKADVKNNVENVKKYDSLYNLIDATMYKEALHIDRKTIQLTSKDFNSLFAKHKNGYEKVVKQKKLYKLTYTALNMSTNYSVVSLVSNEDSVCAICEYPVHEIINMLVTLNAKNDIIDTLVIGKLQGSDLGQHNYYYYIDTNKVIHIKQFKSDEEGIELVKYNNYKISENGFFKRIITK